MKQGLAEHLRVGDTIKPPGGGPSVRIVSRDEAADGQIRLAYWADQTRQIHFPYLNRGQNVDWAAHPERGVTTQVRVRTVLGFGKGHRVPSDNTWPEQRVRQSAQPRANLRRLSYPRIPEVVTSATGLSRAAPANNMRLLAREGVSQRSSARSTSYMTTAVWKTTRRPSSRTSGRSSF